MRFHGQKLKNFPALWHVIDTFDDIMVSEKYPNIKIKI